MPVNRFLSTCLLLLLIAFCLGSLQAQDQDLRKSLKYFNRSLRLDPQHGPSYAARGMVYLAMGNDLFALKDFNAALQNNDSTHQNLYQRAVLLEKMGREQEAVRDFELALLRNPHHAPTLNSVAYYRLQAEEVVVALTLLDRAIEQDSNLIASFLNRGAAHYQLGQPIPAAADFRHVLTLVPEHPIALSNLGLALCAMGQTREGMLHLDRAVEIDQSLAEAWYNRGLARFTQGQVRAGESDFKQAKELNPELEIRVRGEIWEPEK